MASHVFCRELCRTRDEPLAGTGDVADRALLLRWPRGKWRVPRFDSVGMSPALSAAIEAAMSAGLHIALVDRQGETDDIPMLQAQPEGLYADFETESELIEAIRDYAAGAPFRGLPDPRPAILCCTDSRRDACCARFGFATFKALRDAADAAQFQILQCTHVGGCRFAASLVVLPLQHRYGRLDPHEVPDFLSAIAASDVYLPAWRGRPDLPEHMQAAEVAAFGWADAHGIARDRVWLPEAAAPEDPPVGSRIVLDAWAGPIPLSVELEAREFTVQGNCDAVAAGESSSRRRWQLRGVLARTDAAAE